MELLFLDKYEIFIKKFDHFPAMLFNNRARLLNKKIRQYRIFNQSFLQIIELYSQAIVSKI